MFSQTSGSDEWFNAQPKHRLANHTQLHHYERLRGIRAPLEPSYVSRTDRTEAGDIRQDRRKEGKGGLEVDWR